MKKSLFLIIIIFSITGCNSYTELNDLSIVNALGIDYKNNEYNITLSTIERNDTDDNINIYSSNKSSLNEAINDFYLTSDKKLYLSHIDLLILTPNSINYKLNEILDNFLKNNEYRNNFQVIIMNSNDIAKFFNLKINSKKITDLIDTNSNETAIVQKKEVEELINDILIDNNSYLPTISFKDNNFILSGYTLITNKKIGSTITKDKSIILNLLNNKLNKAYIDHINIYHSDIRIKTNKNKINFDIYLTTDTNDKTKLENLKNKINKFLKKYENSSIDILKLKELIKKNNYFYYKNNKDLITKLRFKINIINQKQNNYINGGLYEE